MRLWVEIWIAEGLMSRRSMYLVCRFRWTCGSCGGLIDSGAIWSVGSLTRKYGVNAELYGLGESEVSYCGDFMT